MAEGYNVAEGYDWVEIIEPNSGERMFANVHTGECVWDKPTVDFVKPMDDNQWWELLDQESQRYYYHNAYTKDTVWDRPASGDIIPLTELQTQSSSIDDYSPDDVRQYQQQQEEQEQQEQQQQVEGEGLEGEVTRDLEEESTPQQQQQQELQPEEGYVVVEGGETEGTGHSPQELSPTPNLLPSNTDEDTVFLETATQPSGTTGDDAVVESRAVRSASPPVAIAAVREGMESTQLEQPRASTLDRSSVGSEKGSFNDIKASLDRSGTFGGRASKSPPASKSTSSEPDEEDQGKRVHRRSCSVPMGGQKAAGVLARFRAPGKPLEKLEEFKELAQHKRGFIFRKKVTIANMLCWTKDGIKQPMIITRDKQMRKECPELFRLVQMYMNDRKAKQKLADKLALDISIRCWEKKGLRDELYIQLCRQTSGNTRSESLQRGWELFTIGLAFFPPSGKFRMYLEGYLWRHVEPDSDSCGVPVHVYAQYCHKRVERMAVTGGRKGIRKPTLEEVILAKEAPFNPSMFGGTLDDIFEAQEARVPGLVLPWVITTLTTALVKLSCLSTEGIFRVPGDIDEVNSLRMQIDKGIPPPSSLRDAHVPASLLKLWFRELEDPLIPANYYDECIGNAEKKGNALSLVDSLPERNRLIVLYTVRFLQSFILPDSVEKTKMGLDNLSMVWAPNFLRCPSEDHTLIFQNAKREMMFLRILLKYLDTSEVASF